MHEIYDLNIEEELLCFFDLQYFADEDSPTGQRTEEATPKRRNEAKQDGRVPKSKELNTALLLIFGFSTIYLMGRYYIERCMALMTYLLRDLSKFNFSYSFVQFLSYNIIKEIFIITGPFFIVLMFVSIFSNIIQFGFVFTLKPLKLDLTKLNPVSGISRIFQLKQITELPKAIAKLIIIGYIPYSEISSAYPKLLNTINMPLSAALSLFTSIVMTIIIKICLFMLIVGIIDWKYQKYEFEKSIKMSKYDIKQERKNQEVDPGVKRKIMQRGYKMIQEAMQKSVPKADVVITNPIHLAIALKYDSKLSAAPFIVAKGKNLIADKIKEIARKNDVSIWENKELARKLIDYEIGDEIPQELFTAVAEILGAIWNANERVA